MKKNIRIIAKITILMIVLSLCILRDNPLASQKAIQSAIEYFHTDSEKTREILERLLKQNKNINKSDREIAYVYLALVAIMHEDMDRVDNYLSKLFASNPSFNLEQIKHYTPKLKRRFNKLKDKAKRLREQDTLKKLKTQVRDQQIKINKLENLIKSLEARPYKKETYQELKELKDEIKAQKAQIKKLNAQRIKEEGRLREPEKKRRLEKYKQTLYKNIESYEKQFFNLLSQEKQGFKVNNRIIRILKKMITDSKKLEACYEESSREKQQINSYRGIKEKELDKRKP